MLCKTHGVPEFPLMATTNNVNLGDQFQPLLTFQKQQNKSQDFWSILGLSLRDSVGASLSELRLY